MSEQTSATPSSSESLLELRNQLKAEHDSIVNSLAAEKSKLEADLTSANGRLSETQIENTRLQTELHSLKAELQAAKATVSQLEQSIADKESEGEDLLLLLETNSEKISSMKSRLRELGEQVSESEDEEGDEEEP